MAFNWQLSFIVEDAKGAQSVHSLWLPNTADSVDLQEWSDLYVELLDEMIGGLIVGASVSQQLTTLGAQVEADKSASFGVSDVEEGAIMKYLSTNQFVFRHRIPTVLEGRFVTGTVDLDVTDADVAALRDALLAGLAVTSGTVQPVEHRGEDIAAYVGGVENFTKSR